MKLEIGMFIRIPIGFDKIECFNKENVIGYGFITKANHYLLWHKEDNKFSIDGECFDKEEIKASHNPIDLIEVGDYVNGEQVRYIEEDTDYRVLAIDEDYTYIIAGYDCDGFTRPIKSIVTKEQFESMEYKVV